MKKLKEFQLERNQLQNFCGGAGPYDPMAADPSLTLGADGLYTKHTSAKQNCTGGGTATLSDRESYNSAGDLVHFVEVWVFSGN